MSDPIKHECGIALIRLLKPIDYYHKTVLLYMVLIREQTHKSHRSYKSYF
jgi:hypothetical protein